MKIVACLLGTVGSLMCLSASAQSHANWEAYAATHGRSCPGPFDTFTTPRNLKLGGKSYTQTGYKVEVVQDAQDKDSDVVIGVVSAVKDLSAGTRRNFQLAMQWFASMDVEWVVGNGDLAIDEFDLEEVFAMFAQTGLPTILTIGNSESRGSWSRGFKSLAKHPQVLNGNLVRQIIADDVEFWTMPGYHDKAFLRPGSGCRYREDDIKQAKAKLLPTRDRALLLVSHGPPRGKGNNALDLISDKKHVGDPWLSDWIGKSQISFGIFGHILEAGGRGVGANLKTRIRPKKYREKLYINAGSLSADPWGLHNGKTSWGMALVFRIKGKKAQYEVKHFPMFEEDE
jgi:Icc-related predicted phosphoesterase